MNWWNTAHEPGGFDTASSGFAKKNNKGSRIFWMAAGGFGVALVAVILWLILNNR